MLSADNFGDDAEISIPKQGFTKFPNEMFGQVTTRQAAVYLAARKFEGLKDGASIGQMMDLTGMKRSAVKAAMATLKDDKWIDVKRRGQRQTNGHTFSDEGTFTAVPNDLWRAHLQPAELMLWVSLAYYSTLDQGIFPSVRELAEKMSASHSTVLAATKSMVAKGLIEVGEQGSEETGRGRNHYVLKDIRTALETFEAVTSADDEIVSADLLLLNPTISVTKSDPQRYRIRPSALLDPTTHQTDLQTDLPQTDLQTDFTARRSDDRRAESDAQDEERDGQEAKEVQSINGHDLATRKSFADEIEALMARGSDDYVDPRSDPEDEERNDFLADLLGDEMDAHTLDTPQEPELAAVPQDDPIALWSSAPWELRRSRALALLPEIASSALEVA